MVRKLRKKGLWDERCLKTEHKYTVYSFFLLISLYLFLKNSRGESNISVSDFVKVLSSALSARSSHVHIRSAT